MKKQKAPKILLVDIETAPITSYTWGLFDVTVPLNMVKNDWHLLSWSAKFLGSNKVMYMDQRNEKDISNDSKILKGIWKLLDQADIVIGQNSQSFDIKKLNARFIINKMKPPSSFKQIDTLRLARKHFGFTSNKLEYLTNTLNKKHKKSGHKKFSGFDLWKECLAGNIQAWKEMEKYNKLDVLSLEELYTTLIPWDSSVNFNLYHNGLYNQCKCGSRDLNKYGFAYTNVGKFQRYQCKDCGAETRDRTNLLEKDKRDSLQSGIKR